MSAPELSAEQLATVERFDAAPEPPEITLARYDQRRQAAWQEVVRLCGGGRWTMRVPVDEDRDSDTVITAALDDGEAATAALRRVMALAKTLDDEGHHAIATRISIATWQGV